MGILFLPFGWSSCSWALRPWTRGRPPSGGRSGTPSSTRRHRSHRPPATDPSRLRPAGGRQLPVLSDDRHGRPDPVSPVRAGSGVPKLRAAARYGARPSDLPRLCSERKRCVTVLRSPGVPPSRAEHPGARCVGAPWRTRTSRGGSRRRRTTRWSFTSTEPANPPAAEGSRRSVHDRRRRLGPRGLRSRGPTLFRARDEQRGRVCRGDPGPRTPPRPRLGRLLEVRGDSQLVIQQMRGEYPSGRPTLRSTTRDSRSCPDLRRGPLGLGPPGAECARKRPLQARSRRTRGGGRPSLPGGSCRSPKRTCRRASPSARCNEASSLDRGAGPRGVDIGGERGRRLGGKLRALP